MSDIDVNSQTGLFKIINADRVCHRFFLGELAVFIDVELIFRPVCQAGRAADAARFARHTLDEVFLQNALGRLEQGGVYR